MDNINTAIATPEATRFCMPAFPQGSAMSASVEGRRIAGTAGVFGAHVPAFLKDVVPGVRVWSPPV